ncbi:MAG TPA: glycosyltransferase family 4 protein [Blastocatellia bacterium]|nr:glycosyltransferase family 4 protein [Blastocatellia bacterium]
MKVTIVGPAYPIRGGIAHHSYLISKELKSAGHEVQLVSYKRLYPDLLFPGKSILDTSRTQLSIGSTSLLDTLNPITWLKARKLIQAFSPTLVLIEWWNPILGPVVAFLSRWLRFAGVKCVIECHNVFPHEKTILDLPLTSIAFHPVTNFITHSRQDRETLLKYFSGEKIVRIAPLPSSGELVSRSDSPRAGRTMLFFGFIRRYKGVDVLLEAMHKVTSKMECRLILAGEFYDDQTRYIKLISDYGLASRIELHDGYVPTEEVSALFARADVLIMPYLSATQSGVATMAIESGLPIIASATGGLAEIVADNVNGLLVPPGDAKALADAILAYFERGLGPKLSANMSNNSPAITKQSVVATLLEIADSSR